MTLEEVIQEAKVRRIFGVDEKYHPQASEFSGLCVKFSKLFEGFAEDVGFPGVFSMAGDAEHLYPGRADGFHCVNRYYDTIIDWTSSQYGIVDSWPYILPAPADLEDNGWFHRDY